MNSIFDSLIDLDKSLKQTMPLAAIWLNKPVQLNDKRTVRIEAGDRLRVEKNAISDVCLPEKPATHEVLGCYGNIANTVLYFDLKNLETNELLTLKIK
jgi:hypothetical protein